MPVGKRKQCEGRLKLKVVGKAGTCKPGKKGVKVDEKFVARVAIGAVGEREKSVFTFHAESQCRRLRNEGTKRVSCRCAPQSDCGSACKCAPPFPPSHASHSFPHDSHSFFPCSAVRPNPKASRGWIYLYSRRATWLLFFHCDLRFCGESRQKGS